MHTIGMLDVDGALNPAINAWFDLNPGPVEAWLVLSSMQSPDVVRLLPRAGWERNGPTLWVRGDGALRLKFTHNGPQAFKGAADVDVVFVACAVPRGELAEIEKRIRPSALGRPPIATFATTEEVLAEQARISKNGLTFLIAGERIIEGHDVQIAFPVDHGTEWGTTHQLPQHSWWADAFLKKWAELARQVPQARFEPVPSARYGRVSPLLHMLPVGWRTIKDASRNTLLVFHETGLWAEFDWDMSVELSHPATVAVVKVLEIGVADRWTGKCMPVLTGWNRGEYSVALHQDTGPREDRVGPAVQFTE
jgi:hypothetical protein